MVRDILTPVIYRSLRKNECIYSGLKSLADEVDSLWLQEGLHVNWDASFIYHISCLLD